MSLTTSLLLVLGLLLVIAMLVASVILLSRQLVQVQTQLTTYLVSLLSSREQLIQSLTNQLRTSNLSDLSTLQAVTGNPQLTEQHVVAPVGDEYLPQDDQSVMERIGIRPDDYSEDIAQLFGGN